MVPAGHPINTLMEEHKALLQFAHELTSIVQNIGKTNFETGSKMFESLIHICDRFKESEKHYLREENVLFPYLEKHGFTQPPAMMWSEHNLIRERKGDLYKVVDKGVSSEGFSFALRQVGRDIEDLLTNHYNKENNALFPMALNTFSEDEWIEIGKQFDEIGYCSFTQESARGFGRSQEPVEGAEISAEGKIHLDTGEFTVQELESCLNTLPFDLTFVDKNDRVRYFSEGKDRVFLRTKAVIGRQVQLCHPQESIHVVNKILNAFKTGRKDVAEFWIELNGRLIHIRYFAVRRGGQYLGTVETTQDITDLKKIQGEKRLLDWTL
jgi:DUF438 domain-containing protein